MRAIDERAIKAHADLRFRSEYDYALFEYYRSAKVIAFLERAGVRRARPGARRRLRRRRHAAVARRRGAARSSASIRSTGSATRACGSRASAACGNLHFALADGMALPFADGAFDLVLSHAVIEHVADAPLYLRECARVLAPGGRVYLSTAPYLSFAGAHLPRLKIPVPLHLLFGRRIAFATFTFLARHATWTAQGAGARELVHPAGAQGRDQARRPARDGDGVAASARRSPPPACAIVREELHVTGTVRRLPAFLGDGPQGTTAWPATSSSATWNTCSRTRVPERSACRCLTSTATVRTTAASSRRSTAACSAPTPPTPAGCAGTGSTAAIRTIPAASRRSGSRAKGPAIIGQYATMPVRLAVKGREVTGSWGMDVMVAPERQRRGLGEVLFRTWDRNVGASLGLGPVGRVVPAVPETELAGRRAGAVPGQAAVAARVPASALAGARSTA